MNLAGRVALVTGGGSGIGRAVVLALAEAGARIAFSRHSTSDDEAEATVGEAIARGGEAIALRCDLRRSDQIDALVDDALAEWGSLAYLVNNAAVFPGPTSPEDTDAATFDETIAVNLRAPFLLARAAASALRAERGAIVNVSDAWAARALPGRAAYLASKAGLEGLTRALARDLAPDVRVNAIAPGLIDWPDAMPEKTRDAIRDRIPLGRSGRPEEVAQAVVHLLRAEWITATVMRVDGGR